MENNSAFEVKEQLLQEISRQLEADPSVNRLLVLAEAFALVNGVYMRRPRPQRIL